jgi:hypothetical protein
MGTRGGFTAAFFFLMSFFACAAGDYQAAGGNAAALGYTSAARADTWSALNNPAGLAWYRQAGAGIYFGNRYLLKELSLKALAVTLPAGGGAFGISFRHFGFILCSEINGGISYALRLGRMFSAGVRIGYLRVHVADGFRDMNLCSAEAGFQFHASEHLWMGLHIVNPVPFRISSQSTDRLPTVLRLGLSWRITGGLSSDLEIEKDLLRKPVLKAGIDYYPARAFSVRIGFQSNPSTFTFGAGIEFGALRIDIASAYHMVLGYSPQASIIYTFRKAKGTPKDK